LLTSGNGKGMGAVTPEEVRDVVFGAIRDLAARYGLACPALTATLCPLIDVQGFDSLHCVEIIVDVSAKLHVDTDNDVFWDEKGTPRTLEQIAACLHSRVKGGA
jgi:hypothetical protein